MLKVLEMLPFYFNTLDTFTQINFKGCFHCKLLMSNGALNRAGFFSHYNPIEINVILFTIFTSWYIATKKSHYIMFKFCKKDWNHFICNVLHQDLLASMWKVKVELQILSTFYLFSEIVDTTFFHGIAK